jgi:hypothetical protein
LSDDDASVEECTELLGRKLAAFKIRETHKAAMLQALIDEHDSGAVKAEELTFATMAS